jgi:hypothetical protein
MAPRIIAPFSSCHRAPSRRCVNALQIIAAPSIATFAWHDPGVIAAKAAIHVTPCVAISRASRGPHRRAARNPAAAFERLPTRCDYISQDRHKCSNQVQVI